MVESLRLHIMDSQSKAVLTVCTAASTPEICPPHIWRQLEASWMSGFITDSTAFAKIHLAVSPMPIGQTPGFLSRAISRQPRRGDIYLGSTYEVYIHILLASRAKEWHSSLDAPLKDVHSLLHPCASVPDGPADLVMFIAAERMTLASMYLLGGRRKRLEDAYLAAHLGLLDGESVVLGSVWSSFWCEVACLSRILVSC